MDKLPIFSWETWDWDPASIGWVLFLIYFAVWETWTSLMPGQEMLTDHLRPLFHASPVFWFLTLGLWLWLGLHFLAPSWEIALAKVVSGA